MTYTTERALGHAKGFVARQKHNYRAAAGSLLANLTALCDSICTVALGADSVQLGTIGSIGSGISALISTAVGWPVDRYGIRRLCLLSIGLLAGGVFAYALASS